MSLVLENLRPYNVFIVAKEGGKSYFDKNKYAPEFLNTCGIDAYFGHIISLHAEAVEDLESFLLSSNEVEMIVVFFEFDEATRLVAIFGGLFLWNFGFRR